MHSLTREINLKKVVGNAQVKQALDVQIAEIILKEEVEKASYFKNFCSSTCSFPL